MAKLPNYAQGQGEVVRALCRKSCRGATYHRLERDAVKVHDPNEKYAGCVAYCLKCGGRATDNYNWYR